MEKKSFYKNIFPLFPLFLALCIAVLSRSSTYSEHLIANENQFYKYAENITHGYYAETLNPRLLNGPGYPLYVAVSAVLNIPYVWTRASNIIFLFLASLYLFLILQRYIKRRPALILTYLFGLYPPMLRWANIMYSESLTVLLLLGFCYHFILCYHNEGKYRNHFLLATLFLGYLVLTKIIFAYVIMVSLICSIVFMTIPRITKEYRLNKTVLILLGSLVILTPYIIYTYQLTGKFFYLNTNGGESLYARSTPFNNEFGNRFSYEERVLHGIVQNGNKDIISNSIKLRRDQEELFASLDALSWIEKDSLLTAKAIENMKNYPRKYLKNTAANVSRLFFQIPFSYRYQNLDALWYLIPNIFIVVLAVLSIYPAFIRRKLIPKELILLLIMSLIYVVGYTLLDARGLHLIPVIPIWLLFFSFIYFRILEIKKKETDSTPLSIN